MILKPSTKDNMLELPPLALCSMTKPQLVEFIPRLINLSSSMSSPLAPPSPPTMSGDVLKPEWWPTDVPWIKSSPKDGENFLKQFTNGEFDSADKLRSVVQACYEYMGHEDLLMKTSSNTNVVTPKFAANEEVICVEISDDESDAEVMDVFVCFYCDQWFGGMNGQTELEEHVLTHMDSDQENTSSVQPTATSSHKTTKLKNIPTTEKEKSEPFLPKPVIRKREIPLWKRTDLPCDNGVSQKTFMKSFELITVKQAKTKARTRSSVDIDCEIVAVEGLDSRPMASPRTPRSLMSQLSRDSDSSSRKRLSFCVPDDVSDSEMIEEESPSMNIQGALLNVPFSSLLGKRIKKHIKPDNSACTIKDPEEYCSTHVRNEFLNKLRFRPADYPVTYRRKRKHCIKYSHSYKFNKYQRKDFLKTLQTGLSKESRLLKCQMKKCKLVLKRISEEEINFWKEKKHSHGAEWIDEDISIVEIQPAPVPIERRQFYSGINNMPRPVSLMHQNYNSRVIQARNPYLSSQMFGSASRQGTSQSMPQFLVKKVDKQFNGHQSSKFVYVPINELQTGPKKRIESHSKLHAKPTAKPPPSTQVIRPMSAAKRKPLGPASSSRRKQHFMDVRKDLDDDDVSIYSQSSDEDEDNSENTTPQDTVKPKSFLGSSQRSSPSPAKHMVMCASGGYVETVPTKISKRFETGVMTKKSPVQNAQRHFVSPLKTNGPTISSQGKPELSKTHLMNILTKTTYQGPPCMLDKKMCSWSGVHNKVANSTLKSPSCSIAQQPPLRIVEDVIYIDDD